MIKTTNLRLNLDKPDHRKAYDILKSSDMSYSNTIVAALISFSENEENRKTLLDGIRKIVREELDTVFQNVYSEQTMILSISLDTFSTQKPKLLGNQLSEMEQISMERSGMDICSISGAARSGG